MRIKKSGSGDKDQDIRIKISGSGNQEIRMRRSGSGDKYQEIRRSGSGDKYQEIRIRGSGSGDQDQDIRIKRSGSGSGNQEIRILADQEIRIRIRINFQQLYRHDHEIIFSVHFDVINSYLMGLSCTKKIYKEYTEPRSI